MSRKGKRLMHLFSFSIYDTPPLINMTEAHEWAKIKMHYIHVLEVHNPIFWSNFVIFTVQVNSVQISYKRLKYFETSSYLEDIKCWLDHSILEASNFRHNMISTNNFWKHVLLIRWKWNYKMSLHSDILSFSLRGKRIKGERVITTNNISWKKMRFLSFNILRTRKGFHNK